MSDIRFTDLTPPGWERAGGFSPGVRSSGSQTVHIAGQTGADAGADFGAQFEQALGKVVAVMQAAGGTAQNITMLRYFVTSVDAYLGAGPALKAAWGQHMGRHFPASTLVEVTRLLNPQAQVEIEAEGVLP